MISAYYGSAATRHRPPTFLGTNGTSTGPNCPTMTTRRRMARMRSGATHTPTGFRALFCYRKGQRTRTYGLKPIDERRTELWVVTSGTGVNASTARRLTTVDVDDDIPAFLEDIQLELRRGHWSLTA